MSTFLAVVQCFLYFSAINRLGDLSDPQANKYLGNESAIKGYLHRLTWSVIKGYLHRLTGSAIKGYLHRLTESAIISLIALD